MTPEAKRSRGRKLLEPGHVGDAPQAERQTNYRLRDWGHVAPALLGLPDPGHPLRRLRRVPVPAKDLPVSCPTTSISTSRAIRSTTIRHGNMSIARLRQAGTARNRHDGHLRGFVLVFRPLSPRRVMIQPTDPRLPAPGCRSISISAASSTRSCIFSIPGSSPARCVRPATGSEGTVPRPVHARHGHHETYRAGGDGKPEWVPPAEVVIEEVDGVRAGAMPRPANRDHRLDREDVEVEEECRRSR
jgi:leucyl-tRNA synthetase